MRIVSPLQSGGGLRIKPLDHEDFFVLWQYLWITRSDWSNKTYSQYSNFVNNYHCFHLQPSQWKTIRDSGILISETRTNNCNVDWLSETKKKYRLIFLHLLWMSTLYNRVKIRILFPYINSHYRWLPISAGKQENNETIT